MDMGGNVYFLSDLHLGAGYVGDPRAHEMRVVNFLRSIAGDAAEIYLLGDVLDYWWEYRTVVPRGFVRFFGELARLSDAGVKITWLKGNHDIWIFDYLPSELGVEVVDGTLVRDILGARFLMAHGDGVGRKPRGFAMMRAMFRNRFLQWLYAGVHPRWTIALAHAWSSSSRASEQSHAVDTNRLIAPLLDFSREEARRDPSIRFFVYGHLHVPVDVETGVGSSRMLVLGDWIDRCTYARWDGKKLELLSAALG